MKEKFRSFLLTLLILVIIGILLLFNYYYFKLSPTMLYDHQDQEILQLFETTNDLNDLTLESRYVFGDIYYSASDNDSIYFFLDNGKLFLQRDKKILDYNQVEKIAATIFPSQNNKLYLSIYEKKPVYVISNENYDVFVDFEEFKEVFRVRKGIGNE